MRLIIMRHSLRVDDDSRSGAEEVAWSDMASRPHDPPIVGGLASPVALAAASRLLELGFVPNRIVCSPYRRCLQTASVVATATGVSAIASHAAVGEVSHQVTSMLRAAASPATPFEALQAMLRTGASPFYLTPAQQQEEVAAGVAVVVADAAHVYEATIPESMRRLAAAVAAIAASADDDETVLIVSHGHAVGAACELLCHPAKTVYDARPCGFVVLQRPSDGTAHWRLEATDGIAVLDAD